MKGWRKFGNTLEDMKVKQNVMWWLTREDTYEITEGKKIPCKNRSIRGWYVYNFHNAFICVYVCKMHRKLGKCLPNCDKEEHNGSVSVPLFSSFL